MTSTTEMWLRYTHLDKLYGYLPGLVDALPAIFGLTPAQHAEITAGFDDNTRQVATDLLTDARFAAAVDALPFRPGQTVLAVGDSITDDAQSWAEMLRHLLHLRRPADRIQVVNAGLSTHTTAMVLRRWPATLATTSPDWVLCALGTNDVTRVGPAPAKPQVTLDESLANLAELRRIAEIGAHPSWVWMTPPPVCEDRIAAFPGFQHGQSTWANADIAAFAEALHGSAEPVVDLVSAFGTPADPQLQGPDGVHPTLDGQAAITRALIHQLSPVGG
ncbi:SGNH/GDSL hydrolase family protein [Bounagaea algeriensis]